jgi:hypothetical protein
MVSTMWDQLSFRLFTMASEMPTGAWVACLLHPTFAFTQTTYPCASEDSGLSQNGCTGQVGLKAIQGAATTQLC